MERNIFTGRGPIARNSENSLGSWDSRKSLFLQKFTSLTDKDITFEAGHVDVMLGTLERKLGKTREEIHSIIRML